MQYLKDEIKENIVRSALNEFKEKGFDGASIRSIAQNAKMTSGNIYRYFDSKEKLFEFIMNPVYEKLVQFGERFDNEVISSKVSFVNFDSMTMIKEIYGDILETFSQYGTELMILYDKSEGTRFSGIIDRIKAIIYKILKEVYLYELKNNGKEVKDEFILYVIASSFVEGIGDILRNVSDGGRIRNLVESYAEVIFHNLSERI